VAFRPLKTGSDAKGFSPGSLFCRRETTLGGGKLGNVAYSTEFSCKSRFFQGLEGRRRPSKKWKNLRVVKREQDLTQHLHSPPPQQFLDRIYPTAIRSHRQPRRFKNHLILALLLQMHHQLARTGSRIDLRLQRGK
jgi:hypothetical protein